MDLYRLSGAKLKKWYLRYFPFTRSPAYPNKYFNILHECGRFWHSGHQTIQKFVIGLDVNCAFFLRWTRIISSQSLSEKGLKELCHGRRRVSWTQTAGTLSGDSPQRADSEGSSSDAGSLLVPSLWLSGSALSV